MGIGNGYLKLGYLILRGKTWVVERFHCKDAEVEKGHGRGGEIQEMKA
jgi:hypothetical protein